jgi:hypothetical protein
MTFNASWYHYHLNNSSRCMTQYYRCLFSTTRYSYDTSASNLNRSKSSMDSDLIKIVKEAQNLAKNETWTRVLVEAFNINSILAISFTIFFFVILAFVFIFLLKKANFVGERYQKVQRKRFFFLKSKKSDVKEVKTSFNKNFYFEI